MVFIPKSIVIFNITLLLFMISPHVLLKSVKPSDPLIRGCSSETKHRCLPHEPCWPSLEQWNALNESVHGRLSIPYLTVEPCLVVDETTSDASDGETCERSLERLGEDPFWIQQFSGGVESTGTNYSLPLNLKLQL